MAVTIEESPASVGLALNEIKYLLSSNNRFSTAGTKAKTVIDIDDGGGAGGPKNNDTFSIEWTDADDQTHTLSFTFKTTPSGNTEILAFVGSGTFLDDWAIDNIIPKLKANYYFMRNYNLSILSQSASSISIQIEAKEKGSTWDLTTADTADDFGFTDTTGIDAVERNNFELWMDVFIEETFNNGEFDKNIELASKLNDNEEASFFLHKFLISFLQDDLPSFNTGNNAYSTSILKRFFVFYSEAYGDPASAQSWTRHPATVDEYLLVLMGGLGFVSFPGNSFVADYCTAKVGKKFLTNLPQNTKVFIDSHLFLGFYVTNALSYQINIDITYLDGSVSNHTKAGDADKLNQIALIPASITQLNPTLSGGKTTADIREYSIYVKDTSSSSNKTESFTFLIDQTHYEYSYSFIYKNSFGVYDTLVCTGVRKKTATIQSESLKMIADNSNFSSDSYIHGELKKNPSGFENSLVQSTGYKLKEHIDALQEFVNSSKVYEVQANKYVEVEILTNKLPLAEDNTTIHAMQFEFRYAFNNKAYTA